MYNPLLLILNLTTPYIKYFHYRVIYTNLLGVLKIRGVLGLNIEGRGLAFRVRAK